MRKKFISVLLCMTVFCVILCGCTQDGTGNQNDNNHVEDLEKEESTELDDSDKQEESENPEDAKEENKEDFAEEDSRNPYIKDGNWWIGDIDTGLKAEGDGAVTLVDSYIDENNHLWHEFSDGTKIDAGYVNSETESFEVKFLNYDDSLINKQNVIKGEAAVAPKEPIRKGHHFIGWDKDFTNVTTDLEVNAKYVKKTETYLSIEDAEVKAGEKGIEVAVSVNNNPGILGMTFEILFDENALELVNVRNGSAVKDVLTLTKSKELKSGCKFMWDGQEVSEIDVKDGEILVLEFNISEDAESGDYYINLLNREEDCIDMNLNPISIALENGCVYIK